MDELDPFEVELAQEAIDDFCRQFGLPGSRLYQAYRDFACHAALPLTFSADLLYRLQERFRRDMRGHALDIPWVAVADLMLSHLCHQVRPEIFRLDAHVQAVLLTELNEDRDRFWSEDGRSSRLQEVAQFLIQYAAHQLNHPSHYVREAARAERLNAQTISQPELVRQQLQKTAVTLQPQQDPVATLRLASLVNSFNRSVNLTRSKTDPTRQDFNKLQAYTSGQAQLAEGKSATAVAQQFRTTFGSDDNIQIGGQTLPGLRQLTNEPVRPILPASLGVAFAGDDVTILLRKDTPLPATSELQTMRHRGHRFIQGLGYSDFQIFQGESTNADEVYLLGAIKLDDDRLYINEEIELDVTLTASPDGTAYIQLFHHSGFHQEETFMLVSPEAMRKPSVVDFSEMLLRFSAGVRENSHLATLTAVSNWLNITDSKRTCIITGERGIGKTTIAALLAQYFRGDRQPPNDLYALAPTSTSAVYFCHPSRPETLDPRSFALTVASQWASRDSHFAFLQDTIESHEEYELDALIDELLIKPFNDIFEHIYPSSIIFLVDDLEAALQHPGETTIVDMILRMLRDVPGVRFLLTTQMQPAVRSKLADVEAEFIHLGDRYDNFDIRVGPRDEDGYSTLNISSVIGDLPETMQSDPSTYLGLERTKQIRDLVANSEEIIQIGRELMHVLFVGNSARKLLQNSFNYALSRGKSGIRIRLTLGDLSWQDYPWELCHDGRSYIFNNPDQAILLQRTVGVENVQAPPPLPRPVRLLVAIAAPVDQGRDDVAMQEKVIRAATEEVISSSELDLQILPHATLGELDRVVASYQPHIVQFIGHSSREKDGVLILETETGRSNVVPVAEMMRILAPAPVQCVILSPIGVGGNSLTQLAPQFIRQGIPTVLAEQFVLPDRPAIAFWSAFYRALLLDRLSFEEAIQNARHHLATTHREPFWSSITQFSGQPAPVANKIPEPAQYPSKISDLDDEQNTEQTRLSAWLQNLGFVENPFGYPRAERSPEKMLQQTYVFDEELEQLMLDQHQSVVFLAPYGGGKTAARQYTKFRWEDGRTNTLVAVYKDFATVAKSLPNCRLEDHSDPLMRAIVAAIWQRLDRESGRYEQSYEPNKIWWLKMFETYSPSGLESLLGENNALAEYIVDSEEYKQFQSLEDKRPFNKNISLASRLKKVVDECRFLRFDKVLILVDEVDDFTQNDELNDMQNLLRPLFHTMSIYEHILWKYFVPDELQTFVMDSPARRKRAITVQAIRWDKDQLRKFLRQRLMWATEGLIQSLNEIEAGGDQALARTNLDEEIIDLAWASLAWQEEMGLPRTLLHLGNMLVQVAQKNDVPLITSTIWNEFVARAEFYTYDLRFIGQNKFKNIVKLDRSKIQMIQDWTRGALYKATWGNEDNNTYQYDKGLDLKRLEADLISLARYGSRAHNALFNQLTGNFESEIDLMVKPGHMQIALKEARPIIPTAMIYDYPLLDGNTPGDYSICDTFLDALQGDKPLEECACFQGNCPSYKDEMVVCPSGFWGFRHYLGLPMSVKSARDTPLSIAKSNPPKIAVCSSIDENFVERTSHEQRLQKMDVSWEFADNRDEALDMLKVTKAQIIYFYCHSGLTEKGVPYLSIGSPDSNWFTRGNLLTRRIYWEEIRPLVFINSFNTSQLTPDRFLDLVSGFVETSGAAGVIGPDIPIAEPLATAFAEECLRRFLVEKQTIGEAMRGARLKLLKEGNPLGLVYTLYGSPSLRIE